MTFRQKGIIIRTTGARTTFLFWTTDKNEKKKRERKEITNWNCKAVLLVCQCNNPSDCCLIRAYSRVSKSSPPFNTTAWVERRGNLHSTFAAGQLQRDTICWSFSFCGLVPETISRGENAYSWLGYVQPISGVCACVCVCVCVCVCRWTQAYKQVVPLKSVWMALTPLPVPGLFSVSNYWESFD